MKKYLTLFLLNLSLCFFANAQDFHSRFKQACDKNDTTAQSNILQQWSAANAKDPELFIAYFNYYVTKARREMISVGPNQNNNGFELSDSTGKKVGYLGSSVNYDLAILQKGYDYIDQGISLYPTRLDMRFGKVYMFGQTENYAAFTKTLVETIDYGNSIGGAWLWKEGMPDSKKFFLGTIQEYMNTLYNTGDDNLLPNMRDVSEAVLKYYPDHVESLSNVAITYIVIGQYDKGLPYLLKAEKLAPKDVIVLNNIAEVYTRTNDKQNAKIYLNKIIKYGNKEEQQDAKERLKALQ